MNEILDVLESLNYDDGIQGADVFIEPTGDGRVSDADFCEEEDIYFHDLSRRQLLALASVTMRRPLDEESVLSEGEEPVITETATLEQDSRGMLRGKGSGSKRGRARRRSRGRGPRIGRGRGGASLDCGEAMANEVVESVYSSPASLEQKNRRRARGRGRGTATQHQVGRRTWVKRDLPVNNREWIRPLPRSVTTLSKNSDPIKFLSCFLIEKLLSI
ncbi:unnamed protein product [Parnassius apollo]|uniref:(apollo) hypothetical protein n=1 Tax=Parnassius apollo TaxID=110799 RepID=A0A8S3WVX2_PARAO|nr:unnamed protein product [Parnassius apollo]